MDVAKYRKLKTGGHVQIIKAGNAYALVSAQYDPSTGEAMPSIVEGVNMEQLENTRKALQDQLDNLEDLIKEIKQLG